VTRPGRQTPRPDPGRPTPPRLGSSRPAGGAGRPSPSVGRSTLWDDLDGKAPVPQPLKASWDPVAPPPSPPTKPGPAGTGRRRGAIGWFVRRYGWRAYAIPVLVALTVLVILQVGRSPGSTAEVSSAAPPVVPTVVSAATTTMTVTASQAGGAASPAGAPALGLLTTVTAPPPPAVAAAPMTARTGPDPNGTYKNLSSASLPPGGTFVPKGKNTWHVVKGTSPPMGSGPKRYTFTVEVEDGIGNPQADMEFAALVDSTLADPRSWIGSGGYTLQRVDSGNPSFKISLTSQLTVRSAATCGWQIRYESSCYARGTHRVALNDARWARGAVSFNGDLGSYRVYAINHEVGHALGYLHQPCSVNGGLAPVMMQQSWSTANDDLASLNPQLIPMDGKVCRFNPFPLPLGSASGPATRG